MAVVASAAPGVVPMSRNVIARHEQKPNVMEMAPDCLTMAYGAWAMPDIAKKLGPDQSKELQGKVIVALGEIFQIHERVAEGVKAGVLPAVAQLLVASKDPELKTRILNVLELASRNTLGREAITQPSPDPRLDFAFLPMLKGSLQDDHDPVRAVLANLILNLCVTAEGSAAVLGAGILPELLRLVRADAGERNIPIQETHIKSITCMVTRCRAALETAAEKADPKELVVLLKLEIARGEEYLCKSLDLLNAIATEDKAKDKLIRAGAVTEVCVLLHGAKAPPMGVRPGDDGPIAITEKISWKAKAKLWHLLAMLMIRNDGKTIFVEENWLRLMLSALMEKDSVLVTRAAIQAVLQISEDPRARKVLKVPLCPILRSIGENSGDTVIRKVSEKAVTQLEWAP